MRSKASDYLRRNMPQDDVEKIAALMVEDDRFLRETKDFIDEKLEGADVLKAVDRGGRETKVRQKRGGRWPKYEILGEDGNWWELDDPLWAYAMVRLNLQKKGIKLV